MDRSTATENGVNVDSNEKKEEIHKVSVKIPPFWTDRPEIWFFQVEAQFKINNITKEDTKFNYLVAQLEPKYIENIWDIINSASSTKFTDSKTRLLNLFKESESARIKRLITGIELGNMKPSQLLQKLRTVATEDVSENLIKTLWLQKLPDLIKNILLVSEEDLNKLSIMADKISDMSPKTEAFSVKNSLETINDSMATASGNDLLNRIASLEQQISQLNVWRQSRPNSRGRENHSRSRSRSRKRYNPKGKLCYYHFHFGNHCYPEKCKQPCSWNEPDSQQENLNLQ